MCATQKAPSFRIEDILNYKPNINNAFLQKNNIEPDKRISETKHFLDPSCVHDTRDTLLQNSDEKRKLDTSSICVTPKTLECYVKRNKMENIYSASKRIDPPNSVHVIKTVTPISESQNSVDLSKCSDKPPYIHLNSVPHTSSTQSLTLGERLFNNTFSPSCKTDFKTLKRSSSDNQAHSLAYGYQNNLMSFVPRESAAFKYPISYYDKSVAPSLNLRNGFNYFSECTQTTDPSLMLRQGFSGRYMPHPISYYPYGLDRGQGPCGFWPISLGKRKGGQVRFSAQQTTALERRFLGNKYLSPEDRRALASSLKLTDRQVKTWFQNRRAKWRRANNLLPDDKSDGLSEDETTSNGEDCATLCDVAV